MQYACEHADCGKHVPTLPGKAALLYAPDRSRGGNALSVNPDTVRRIALLARIAVAEEEIEPLQAELNAILAFVEQLAKVSVEGVEPMTSVIPMQMKQREDKVTDGDIADDIVKNAPAKEDDFFVVPKVVE
jgi:aspartyl-tRNA(Asn)/glutamyl-tRNA(Gln) amidotransferase subunit C